MILRAISYNSLLAKKLVWILHRTTELRQSFQALNVFSISKCKKEGTRELHFNLKKAGGIGLTTPAPPPCSFSKNVFPRERVKPHFFVTFNIIISLSFLKILLRFLKSFRRFFLSILNIFIDFLDFSHFLVAKKLMTSAYNRWCQHFVTFNSL